MWHLLSSIALPQPLSVTRHTIPFPRGVLRKFIADTELSVPGTKIESPGFVANGCEWQVALYPFGGNADPSYAGRVGVYLRMIQQDGSRMEVDTSFTMALNVIPAAMVAVVGADVDAEAREEARRGAALIGGMTFCPAEEAGESVGRCEDWACRPAHRTCGRAACSASRLLLTHVWRALAQGAHVYPSTLLLKELEDEACVVAVDLELSVWEQRPCRQGASLAALADQVKRLPSGSIRVGEVVVSLGGGSSEDEANAAYSCERGVEYRIVRLESSDGSARFDLGPSDAGVAYILPTARAARGVGTFSQLFDSNEEEMAQKLGGGAELENAQSWRRSPGGGGEVVAERSPTAPRWPYAMPIDRLPPLSSRLGFRALPARLSYAARNNARLLLLFVVVGLSPLWGGFLLSQLGSAYVIPSRSMEATLRVGDVVLAEKVSRLVSLPYEVNDLVLFSPPANLLQIVEESGGAKLGPRDLFVKRVAALAGDTVELLPDGAVAVNGVPRKAPPLQCVEEGAGTQKGSSAEVSRVIPDGQVFVLGDCPARSTDSRTWGPLPMENVVARPVVRVWPLERRGTIDTSLDLNPFVRSSKPFGR